MLKCLIVIFCSFFCPNAIVAMEQNVAIEQNNNGRKHLDTLMQQYGIEQLQQISEDSEEECDNNSLFIDYKVYDDKLGQYFLNDPKIQNLSAKELEKFSSKDNSYIKEDLIFIKSIYDDVTEQCNKDKSKKTVLQSLDTILKIRKSESKKLKLINENIKKTSLVQNNKTEISQKLLEFANHDMQSGETQYAEFIAIILRYPGLFKIGTGDGLANIVFLQKHLNSVFNNISAKDLKDELGSLFEEYTSFLPLPILQKIISVTKEPNEQLSTSMIAAWFMHYEASKILYIPYEIPCCDKLIRLPLDFNHLYSQSQSAQFESDEFYEGILDEYKQISNIIGQGMNFPILFIDQLLQHTVYKRLVVDLEQKIKKLCDEMNKKRPQDLQQIDNDNISSPLQELLETIKIHEEEALKMAQNKANKYEPTQEFLQLQQRLKDAEYYNAPHKLDH